MPTSAPDSGAGCCSVHGGQAPERLKRLPKLPAANGTSGNGLLAEDWEP
jgi:hypothetical protein